MAEVLSATFCRRFCLHGIFSQCLYGGTMRFLLQKRGACECRSALAMSRIPRGGRCNPPQGMFSLICMFPRRRERNFLFGNFAVSVLRAPKMRTALGPRNLLCFAR